MVHAKDANTTSMISGGGEEVKNVMAMKATSTDAEERMIGNSSLRSRIKFPHTKIWNVLLLSFGASLSELIDGRIKKCIKIVGNFLTG